MIIAIIFIYLNSLSILILCQMFPALASVKHPVYPIFYPSVLGQLCPAQITIQTICPEMLGMGHLLLTGEHAESPAWHLLHPVFTGLARHVGIRTGQLKCDKRDYLEKIAKYQQSK